jgi:hypothetical protein
MQICIPLGYLGHGRMLFQTSTEARLPLLLMEFRGSTLPVSSENHAAVHLFKEFGFQAIKRFIADVWPQWRPHRMLVNFLICCGSVYSLCGLGFPR